MILALEAGSIFWRVALNSVFSIFGASGADALEEFDIEPCVALELKEAAAKGLRFKRF